MVMKDELHLREGTGLVVDEQEQEARESSVINTFNFEIVARNIFDGSAKQKDTLCDSHDDLAIF